MFFQHRAFYTGVNVGEDILECDVPLISFFVNSVKTGAFPLWNPHKALGIPFFEVSFMGPYYPFVLFYFIFDISQAINYGMIAHVFLGAIFMLLLCRELKFGFLISLFCSISWCFSNVFMQFSSAGWLPQFVTTTYLPLLIYLFLKIQNTLSKNTGVYLILAAFAVALSISGGIMHYSIAMFYCFFIFIIPVLNTKKAYKDLLIIFICGALISSVYWGPIFINIKDVLFSNQTLPPNHRMYGYSISELFNFINPGNSRRGYFGILALIFGLLGLFTNNKFKIGIRSLFIFSLVLMLKYYWFGLTDYIPFVKNDLSIWIWHVGLMFSLIISAGYFLRKLQRTLKNFKWEYYFLLVSIILVQIHDLDVKNPDRKPLALQFEEYFLHKPIFEFLKTDKTSFRVYNALFDFEYYRINQGMLEGVSCIQSTIRGVSIPRITSRHEAHEFIGDDFLKNGKTRIMDLCNVKYYITDKVFSPKYYNHHLTVSNIESKGMNYDYYKNLDSNEIYVYESNTVFPRAFTLNETNISYLDRNFFEANNLVDLDLSDHDFQILSNHRISQLTWKGNKYIISYNSPENSFLFLSEMYDASWKASLDGKALKIHSPYGIFMGAYVPKGKHLIEFSYRPLYFYGFLLLSIITTAILLSIFTILMLKKRTK